MDSIPTQDCATARGWRVRNRVAHVLCHALSILFVTGQLLAAVPARGDVPSDAGHDVEPGQCEEELPEIRTLADGGDARAQTALGLMYIRGTCVDEDPAQAARWLLEAATQGYTSAQVMLGKLHLAGYGVTQDDTKALKWFEAAAAQHSAQGQLELGNMHGAGRGVARDLGAAVKWVRMAAEQGLAEAQTQLAVLFLVGTGMPQDVVEGARWLKRAALQGNAVAQGYLGLMYAEGVGAGVDLERAYLWLELASDGGDNPSVENVRNLVAGQLTEAQREDVLRRVRECRASHYARCAETGEDAVRAGDVLRQPVPE